MATVTPTTHTSLALVHTPAVSMPVNGFDMAGDLVSRYEPGRHFIKRKKYRAGGKDWWGE